VHVPCVFVISVDPVGQVVKPNKVDCAKQKLNLKKRIVIIIFFKLSIETDFKFYANFRNPHQQPSNRLYTRYIQLPFFHEPVIIVILEKDNADKGFCALIGATDLSEAVKETIRKYYVESKGRNAVHGSDSDENTEIEGQLNFSANKIV